MNAAYLHLLTNHIPVFGFLFGAFLMAYGLVRRNTEVKKLAAFVLLVAALGTLVAYYSGHNAEEMVEHMAGVSEAALEKHEDAAKLPFFVAIITAIGSLVYLIKAIPFFDVGLLILSLVGLGSGFWAAKTGGAIKHWQEQGLTAPAEGEEEEEDENGGAAILPGQEQTQQAQENDDDDEEEEEEDE